MDLVEFIFAAIIIPLLYFLPTFLALKKRRTLGIFLINLFLGWTVAGWIVALVWAITEPKEEKRWMQTCDKCGLKKSFDQPLKLFKCPNCGHENINS